ncbi:MAG: ATP-binding protein [Campylobacterales bacterium]
MIEYEKLILDAVDGGIVVLDKELNILCWNGWLEMVTGIKKESALGQKLYDVVEIEDERLNALKRNIKASLKLEIMTFMPPSTHGYLIKAELKNLFSSFYKTMQQEIKIIPLDAANGIVSIHINDQTAIMESRKMLEAYNQDLEERVKKETAKRLDTERALIQQAKMALMGDMIGAIAHQWRQPLNALGLYIQDVPAAYKLGELDQQYIDTFKSESMNIVQAMSRTIDDFRNFFAPNKKKETFCVEDALLDTIRIVSVQMKNYFIDIHFNHDGKNYITGYKNELEQVFLNILSNAKDALLETKPENMFINIAVSNNGDYVDIVFEDSAGGIKEGIMERVFEPYFTTKEQGKGTGIGLYMSRQIIERHLHGELSVTNGEHGARFFIELPIFSK